MLSIKSSLQSRFTIERFKCRTLLKLLQGRKLKPPNSDCSKKPIKRKKKTESKRLRFKLRSTLSKRRTLTLSELRLKHRKPRQPLLRTPKRLLNKRLKPSKQQLFFKRASRLRSMISIKNKKRRKKEKLRLINLLENKKKPIDWKELDFLTRNKSIRN